MLPRPRHPTLFPTRRSSDLVARRQLRQAFIDADLGISGANLAIADTGTLVVVSNEGNQRLVSTLPPVHVAVRSEEHTSELQSLRHLVCRLLLERQHHRRSVS